MPHPWLSTRKLATVTLAGLATFPLIVTALHVIQRGSYDPATQAVSELALGRAGWLMAVAFPAAGLAILAFAVLIRRTDPGAVAVPVLASLSGVCTMLAAVFRADPENASTLHGAIHQLLGVGSFLTLTVAMFICARRFRHVDLWRPLATPTLVWGLAAVTTFLLVPIPLLGVDHFGVAQRLFLAVWLSWPITLTVRVRRAAAVTDPRPVRGAAPLPRRTLDSANQP
jgi:hypothetical membrane protein